MRRIFLLLMAVAVMVTLTTSVAFAAEWLVVAQAASTPAITAAVVTGSLGFLGSLGAAFLTTRTNTRLAVTNERVDSVERELQVKLLMPRLEAYRALWEIMEGARPHPGTQIEPPSCRKLHDALSSWYYKNGYGIFLTNSQRHTFGDAKEALWAASLPDDNSNIQSKAERAVKLLHDLRVDMKNTVGSTYGEWNPDEQLPD